MCTDIVRQAITFQPTREEFRIKVNRERVKQDAARERVQQNVVATARLDDAMCEPALTADNSVNFVTP